MLRFVPSTLAIGLTLLLAACGNGSAPAPASTGGSDGMGGAPPTLGEATDIPCLSDLDCSDGAFCNGEEKCFDGFCYTGIVPRCDDGVDCTIDVCSHAQNRCLFSAPDEDGDGHSDAACLGPGGEVLGDDCDDDDSDRYPGNQERCAKSDPEHDEDCDPSSFGYLDEDLDGATSDLCCNEDEDGERICGDDCDDDSFRRYPQHPEICDDVDNDCDGEVDKNTKEVLWYPDADGDHYGGLEGDGVLSCAPIEGHDLRATDCNDGAAAVHSAALEFCDGLDNDCDGDVDEQGVCACSPEGAARTCACSDKATGVQACVGGLWDACDCTECVNGHVDCVGDLLPRECVDGRWKVLSACKGQTSICLEGECVCPDGTMDCTNVPDLFPPTVYLVSPPYGQGNFPLTGMIGANFSEPVTLASAALAINVVDEWGEVVEGTVTSSGSSVVFTPAAPWKPGTSYTMSIAPGVLDLAGNAMVQSHANTTFTTAPAHAPVALVPPEGWTYSTPSLDVSDSGTVMGLIRKKMDSSINVGFGELSFDGANWSEKGTAWMGDGEAEVLVDDRGWAIALLRNGSMVTRFDYQGESWATGMVITNDNATNFPIAKAMNGAGRGFFVTQSSDPQFIFNSRKIDGGYDIVPLSLPSTGASYFLDAILTPSGRALAAWEGTGQLNVAISAPDIAEGFAFYPSPITSGVTESALVADSSGGVTLAYVSLESVALSSYPQISFLDGNEGSAWSGVPAGILPSRLPRTERAIQMGIDGSDVVHMAYLVDNFSLRATRRQSGGSWEQEAVLSIPPGNPPSEPQLRVAENGTAVLVWTQYSPQLDLWGARYIPGMGWGAAARLESLLEGVVNVAVDIAPTGEAYILFSTYSATYATSL